MPNIVPGKAKFGGDKKAPKGDEVENPFGTKRGSIVDRPIGGHQPRDLGTEKPIGGSSSSRSEENSFGTKRGSNIDRPISTLRKSAETQQSRSLETDSPPLPLDDDVDAIPFGKHKRSGAKLQPPPPPSRKPIAGRPLARPSSSGSIGSNSSNSPTSTTAGVARGVRPSLPGKPVVAKPAKLLMKKDSVTRTRAAENSTNRRSAEAGDARLVDLTGGTTRKGVRTTTRSC